jgi:hypothetical protein
MVLKPAKTLLAAAGLCGLLALQLPAQGGLGAPPGRMGGGGVRGGSSGGAPQSDGHIPSAGTPSDSGTQGSSGLSATPSGNTGASRPTGNILFPGTPGRSNHGSIVSPGLPGSTGHTSILSPGLPGPYRPGNVLTPGTPLQVNPPAPYPGGLFSGPVDRGRPADQGPGFGRHRRGAVVYPYPYVYFGYPYGYGNGGYAIETGGVTRTSSSASYVVEGHLDTTAEREPHSRIYEVGPGTGDGTAAVDSEPAPSDGAPGEAASGPAQDVFYLIALKGGLIYAAREPWLLGNTVHFVTLQGDHYVVSLREVDLDLSAQLNRERGLKFVLEVREQVGGSPPDPGATP